MLKKILIAMGAIAMVVLLSACATYGGYTPQVDMTMERYPQTVQRDMLECRQFAQERSSTASETVKGGAVGGLIGGAGGAVLGAITGNPGAGAAIGALIGGFGGGTYQGMGADNTFKRTYIGCMRNRGHEVQ